MIASWLYSEGTRRFQKNNTAINDEQKENLLNQLREQADYIRTQQFNTIIIEGYASPEPRLVKGLDTNEQLAFNRANAVANVLVSAGIPRRCLGLMSYGRNRSKILYGPKGFKQNGSEQDIKDFDSAYDSYYRHLVKEDELASDRKIEIRAVSDDNYFCTSSELSGYLSAVKSAIIEPQL